MTHSAPDQARAHDRTAPAVSESAQTFPPKELTHLRRWAAGVVIFLSLTVVAFSVWTWWLLRDASPQESDLGSLALLALVGGTLGSAISCLLSVANRISNGWESTRGIKYPEPKPRDKFVARMIPLFLVRPLLGGVSGLLIFSGVVGGFLIATGSERLSFSPPGLVFLSLLAGLFAKTFLERLKDVFDSFFGTVREAKTEAPASQGVAGVGDPTLAQPERGDIASQQPNGPPGDR